MDTPDTPAGAPRPAPPAEAPAPVQHPQQGGAWVRQPDGRLVREGYSRDPAAADTQEQGA